MPDLRSSTIRLAYLNSELRPRLLQAIMAAAMPEPEFWKIVDDLGWGTRTTQYKAIKKQLIRNLSPNHAAAFSTTLAVLRGKLYKRLEAWEKDGEVTTGPITWDTRGVGKPHRNPREFGLGDDGFGDLLHHIIGLGKREYAAAMRNPQVAFDRARAKYGTPAGFTESFEYAVPHTSDYAMLDVSTYQKRAEKIHELVEWLLMRPEARTIRQPLEALSGGMIELIRGQAHKLVDREMEMDGAAKAVETWWDKIARGDDELREALYAAMPDKLMAVSHLYWGTKNLITDMKDYLFD